MTWSVANYPHNTYGQSDNNADHSRSATEINSSENASHQKTSESWAKNIKLIQDNDALINFNRNIAWAAKMKEHDVCVKFFNLIKQRRLVPDVHTYNPMIYSLLKTNNLPDPLFILKEMHDEHVLPDTITYEHRMRFIKRANDSDAARILLDEMSSQGILPNLKIYNLAVGLYVNLRDLNGALAILKEMAQNGIKPSVSTYSILMPLYADPLDLLTEPGFETDITVYNAVAKSYIAKGDLPRAADVWVKMKRAGISPDLDTYNIMLGCYAEYDAPALVKMHSVLEEMRQREIKPDKATYSILMDYCMDNPFSKDNVELLKELKQAGNLAHIISCNILMEYFTKNSKAKELDDLWKEMSEGIVPHVAAYKLLMDFYLYIGNWDEQKLQYLQSPMNPFQMSMSIYLEPGDCWNICKDLFCEMQQAGILPETETFGRLMQAGSNPKCKEKIAQCKMDAFFINLKSLLKKGKIEEHANCIRKRLNKGYVSDIDFCNRLMNTYIDTDHIKLAWELLNEMQKPESTVKPDVVTYNVLMKSFLREDKNLKYLMQKEGVYDAENFENLKKTYRKRINAVRECWNIYEVMQKRFVMPNIVTFNTMLKICAKAEHLQGCKRVLAEMQLTGNPPNLITYTTSIGYYAKYGNVDGALDLFKEMKDNEIEPDKVIYEIVMKLCLEQKRFEDYDSLHNEATAITH